MKLSSETLMIIPAAGYGSRVGFPVAKEMLPDPSTGNPLIYRSLKLAQDCGFPSLVMTREEKTPLIHYIREHFPETTLGYTEKTKEWPDTILKTAGHWRKKNIVVLPDTTFAPESVIQELAQSLERTPAVFATHQPEKSDTWGCVRIQDGHLSLCEKPQDQQRHLAWGIFGFQKEHGEALAHAMLQSTFDHQWKHLNFPAKFFPLEMFQDLTRGN